MNQNFEQDIPMPAIVAGFVVLLVVSNLLRIWNRNRTLIKEGQLLEQAGLVPSVEQRVAGNSAWASGEIVSKGRTYMIVLCISALAWNLIIGVGFVKALMNPAIETAPKIVAGIFAAIGIVIAVFAVRATLRYLRFGESRCCIQGKAGILGKSISGRIVTDNEIAATGDYKIELKCIETYHTGSGKNRRAETNIHWQAKQLVPHSGKSPRAGIPFSFDLPKYPPETGYQLARGKVHWQLSIDAPVKGVDYGASFVVPVFKLDYTD